MSVGQLFNSQSHVICQLLVSCVLLAQPTMDIAGGNLVNSKHSCLQPHNVDMLLFLYQNLHWHCPWSQGGRAKVCLINFGELNNWTLTLVSCYPDIPIYCDTASCNNWYRKNVYCYSSSELFPTIMLLAYYTSSLFNALCLGFLESRRQTLGKLRR